MMHLHVRNLTVITLVGCLVAFGQVKETTPTRERGLDLQQSASALMKEDLSARLSAIPMEGPVHPDRYIVGPSDVFLLGLWGPFSASYPVTVTPEGTIIIPTVGEVPVAGMKLSEAKIRVLLKMRTKYTSGDVTFTLLKPRSIVVTLRGSVLRQGQYVVTSVDRVEKLLSLGANVESSRPNLAVQPWMQTSPDALKEEYVKAPKVVQVEEIYDRASMRNILLMRKNGDTVRVDILKYYATGEDRCNPFLVDGDVVLVPPRHLSRNAVGVYGAVNAPGQYEWVEGDSLLSLVQIAQGAMKGSDLEHVAIQRVNDLGEKAGELQVNLLNIQKGSQPDVPLERGDRIVVPLIPDNRGVYAVTVAGQVNRPGMYPILRGSTRLSQILAQVGGFKDDALLSGAFILRRDDEGQHLFGSQISLWRNIRSQQLTICDSAYFYMDLRTSLHPVVVDFVKLVQNRDSTQDVVLRNEDIIYVPANSQSVLVHGQVQKPGYMPFVPGMRYKDYIEKAGGYSELAISGDTKVIKKATLEWLDPSDTVIEPGDQIWVPKEFIKDPRQTWPVIRDIIAVAASVGTTILIAIQVFR
ncbi:MAG: SLBB domain-containing protein [Ignavibacteria bacterium]|nr:SLBB domain-containing protein [Ignavibacteria bacterium]